MEVHVSRFVSATLRNLVLFILSTTSPNIRSQALAVLPVPPSQELRGGGKVVDEVRLPTLTCCLRSVWMSITHQHREESSGSNVDAVVLLKRRKRLFLKMYFSFSVFFFSKTSLPLLVWTAQMEVLENINVITTTSAWHLFLNVVVLALA